MTIEPATTDDLADWATMRSLLWPDATATEHRAELARTLAAAPGMIALICRADDRTAVGFAEAALRHDYVNGCDTSPVVFLEGIFVMPGHRGSGIAAALVERIEAWSRAQGCSEFASDAPLDTVDSHAFHAAIGFIETERVVYFRKVL